MECSQLNFLVSFSPWAREQEYRADPFAFGCARASGRTVVFRDVKSEAWSDGYQEVKKTSSWCSTVDNDERVSEDGTK